MRKLVSLFVTLGVAALGAVAQTAGGIAGKWNVTYQGEGGGQRTAALDVSGASGTWRTFAKHNEKTKNHPCVERDYPVRVEQDGPGAVLITVNRSSVVAGCVDFKASLKRLDDATFDGIIDGERPIRLKR